MLQYHTIPVTAFAQNCSIIWCDETLEAAVIDPGGNITLLLQACQERKLNLKQIWITHAHIDHAGAADELARMLDLPIIGPHKADAFWVEQLPRQGAMFGFPPAAAFTPERWLEDGDTLQIGNCILHVLHCPGHTPGHVVFHHNQSRRAFVGDVLFAGSIGRTDFPGSNYQELLDSIRGKLWPLGDDVVFIPGHGPESSFGAERRHNPFVHD